MVKIDLNISRELKIRMRERERERDVWWYRVSSEFLEGIMGE